MFKRVVKIILIAILAIIFARALMVTVGFDMMSESKVDNIAVIDFIGPIYESEIFIKRLEKLAKAEDVKGIIIKVNSPGGLVTPSNEIYEYILTIKKPVYVAMGSVAASGGYLVSLAANKIYAQPSSITGSIGVIISYLNMKGLYEMLGLKSVVLKSGVYKAIGTPDTDLTEGERTVMMGVVMDMYDQFITTVASRRNIDKEEIRQIADGRVYTGRQAKQLNLVDVLGSYNDAFIDMKILLNKPDLILNEVEEEKSIWQQVLEAKSFFMDRSLSKVRLLYLAEVY